MTSLGMPFSPFICMHKNGHVTTNFWTSYAGSVEHSVDSLTSVQWTVKVITPRKVALHTQCILKSILHELTMQENYL